MAAAGHLARADADDVAAQAHDLYTRFGSQIKAYCMVRLRSREEAEDAVQTTFMNAFRALKRGTATHAEQAWLFKIAQNVCLARQSSSTRRLRLEKPDDFETLQEIIPAPSCGGADELIGLEDVLATMPENQRRAILLREWQGLSYREIAGELDLSQAAIEMLIFRARRALARGLEQEQQPAPQVERRVGRRLGQGLDLGGIVAALKSLFAGGAAVKALAVAVTAGTVAGTATVELHRPLAPPTRSKPTGPTPSLRTLPTLPAAVVAAAAPTTDGTKLPARRRPVPRSVPAGVSAPPARHDPGVDPVVPAPEPSAPALQVPSTPAAQVASAPAAQVASAPAPQVASAPAPQVASVPPAPAAAPVGDAAPSATHAPVAHARRRAGTPAVEPRPPAAVHAPGSGHARGRSRRRLKVRPEPVGHAADDPAIRRPDAERQSVAGARGAAVVGRQGRGGGANRGGTHGGGSMQPLTVVAVSALSAPAAPAPVVAAAPATVPPAGAVAAPPATVPPAGAVAAPPSVVVETAPAGPPAVGREHARDENGAAGGDGHGNGHGHAYGNGHGNGNGKQR
ncbi:MAG TPA: sigma-70 family RNA polymerase sigma factor [Gaiellaceae bacterium]|nr:sigma-70 family RNA polymerase sigma factor [Gaiellaceae bacterium]